MTIDKLTLSLNNLTPSGEKGKSKRKEEEEQITFHANLQVSGHGGLFILSRVGKLAAILSLTLFAIQPTVWAKTKTAVMECTMRNGKIVDKSGHPIGDCVLMKDGRMMMITKGKMMPMTKDITLAGGTVCKVDGTCVLKNGKQIKLSNGEGIEVAGEQVFRVKGLSPPGSHFQ